MSFTEVPRIKYANYNEFVTEFLLTVVDEGVASVVINYMDYIGLIQSLNTKVINGESLCLDVESADNFDTDIEIAKKGKGFILVTVFKESPKIIGEPVIYENSESLIACTYYVEKDAEDFVKIPVTGKIIPFEINKHTLAF